MPWKNGAGTTHEIVRWPDDPGDFAWRVSIASISRDGPFSAWPGVERAFAVIEGNGVVLGGLGAPVVLGRDDAPARFDGGLPIVCGLVDGPVQAINLMVRTERAGGEIRRIDDATGTVSGIAAGVCLAGAGPCECRIDAGAPIPLAAGEALVVEARSGTVAVRIAPGAPASRPILVTRIAR